VWEIAACGWAAEITGAGGGCLLLPAGPEALGVCSSVDRWFSDPRTMASSGGIAERIYACMGISGSNLDSIEMVLGKKRGGLCGSRNLRRMS